MAMTCVAAMIGAASIGLALFGGVVPDGTIGMELMSLALAALTALAVASASALDI
ncbi:hypothetical protein ABIE41_000816 [Bosea sp. OAE506]|jgi:hypothetical protein|uniref:hypothetical protein n=1 Tax=Bosea sp. OAE506 TaxID=2663870 RepID=UPI00178A9089